MLTFRVDMDASPLTAEADGLFLTAQYCRALPLYQQHINEVHQHTATSPAHLLASARSYRMLAKCYRYMGQWDHALPALLDALRCIAESRTCNDAIGDDMLSADHSSRALQLEQHVHHMLADTYSVLAEQQHTNVSNPHRLSRALYHCLVAEQLATQLLDAGEVQGQGEECVAAVDASVAVQVSLGCVYRLMGRQAQQQLLRQRQRIEHPSLDAASDEQSGCETEVEAVAQWRWQRHDILNLQWLSVAELEELIAEWLCEAKAALNGAIRPLQSFRAHHLLVAICDELHKLYEARNDA